MADALAKINRHYQLNSIDQIKPITVIKEIKVTKPVKSDEPIKRYYLDNGKGDITWKWVDSATQVFNEIMKELGIKKEQ